MINLLYEPLPESITADGEEYPIVTDFREWFRFADMIHDNSLSSEEKLLLMAEWLLEQPELITSELVRAVFDFYGAKLLAPDPPNYDGEDEAEQPPQRPVFDWKYDAKYLLADFRRYYGIDLLTAEMHWWEFRSLFAALPDDSLCQKRIAYRSADLSQIKDSKRRAEIARIQQLIALPYEMTDDEISAVFE